MPSIRVSQSRKLFVARRSAVDPRKMREHKKKFTGQVAVATPPNNATSQTRAP